MAQMSADAYKRVLESLGDRVDRAASDERTIEALESTVAEQQRTISTMAETQRLNERVIDAQNNAIAHYKRSVEALSASIEKMPRLNAGEQARGDGGSDDRAH